MTVEADWYSGCSINVAMMDRLISSLFSWALRLAKATLRIWVFNSAPVKTDSDILTSLIVFEEE